MHIMSLARVLHEVNRVAQKHNGETVGPDWLEAPQEQIDSTVNGIYFAYEGATPEELHANWLREKEEKGWHYGEVKSEEDLTHPCMVPYDKLPEGQKLKDELFNTIVSVFKELDLVEADA